MSREARGCQRSAETAADVEEEVGPSTSLLTKARSSRDDEEITAEESGHNYFVVLRLMDLWHVGDEFK